MSFPSNTTEMMARNRGLDHVTLERTTINLYEQVDILTAGNFLSGTAMMILGHQLHRLSEPKIKQHFLKPFFATLVASAVVTMIFSFIFNGHRLSHATAVDWEDVMPHVALPFHLLMSCLLIIVQALRVRAAKVIGKKREIMVWTFIAGMIGLSVYFTVVVALEFEQSMDVAILYPTFILIRMVTSIVLDITFLSTILQKSAKRKFDTFKYKVLAFLVIECSIPIIEVVWFWIWEIALYTLAGHGATHLWELRIAISFKLILDLNAAVKVHYRRRPAMNSQSDSRNSRYSFLPLFRGNFPSPSQFSIVSSFRAQSPATRPQSSFDVGVDSRSSMAFSRGRMSFGNQSRKSGDFLAVPMASTSKPAIGANGTAPNMLLAAPTDSYAQRKQEVVFDEIKESGAP